MYIPREGSRRSEFIEIINNSGGITIERLIARHGMMDFPEVCNIASELRKLVRLNCIKQIGTVFFPIFRDKPVDLDVKVNLAPPREPIPFKPLQTFPPNISPRGQPIERRHFKTCKSNVRYQGQNDL